jgi:hypothetical protein
MANGDKPCQGIEAAGRVVVNGHLKCHAQSAKSLSPRHRLSQEPDTDAAPPAGRSHPQTQNLPLASDGPAQNEADGITRLACNEAERPWHLENSRQRLGAPGIFEALPVKRSQNVGVRVAGRNKLQVLWGAHRGALKRRQARL